jgi:hypothetical protein
MSGATQPKRLLIRMSDRDRSAARSELCDSFYRFIVHCCRAGLIDESTVREQCERHAISIDPRDLCR